MIDFEIVRNRLFARPCYSAIFPLQKFIIYLSKIRYFMNNVKIKSKILHIFYFFFKEYLQFFLENINADPSYNKKKKKLSI